MRADLIRKVLFCSATVAQKTGAVEHLRRIRIPHIIGASQVLFSPEMMGCAYYKAKSIGRHLPHTRDCGSSHTLSRHVLPFNVVHKPFFTVSIAVSVKLLNNINDIPKSEKGRSKWFRDIPKSEKGRSKWFQQIPANIQSDLKVEKRDIPKIGAFQNLERPVGLPKGNSKIGAYQTVP